MMCHNTCAFAQNASSRIFVAKQMTPHHGDWDSVRKLSSYVTIVNLCVECQLKPYPTITLNSEEPPKCILNPKGIEV